uniref:Uncharacterized protein n=1 Tax=Vespula pensylvanica TaxID=30213 RepID=A0A834PEC0_VESPE|nr:hypothetical protein H0235_000677 [Vespula pensylvanica]
MTEITLRWSLKPSSRTEEYSIFTSKTPIGCLSRNTDCLHKISHLIFHMDHIRSSPYELSFLELKDRREDDLRTISSVGSSKMRSIEPPPYTMLLARERLKINDEALHLYAKESVENRSSCADAHCRDRDFQLLEIFKIEDYELTIGSSTTDGRPKTAHAGVALFCYRCSGNCGKYTAIFDTSTSTTEWSYPSTAPSYPAPPVSSGGSYSPIPGGAFSYPGESLSHHPTTEPVPLPTVLPSESQQDTYTPNCVSMYSGHGTSSTSLPLIPGKPNDPDIFAGGGTGSASPGYHYGSWTPGPATPVPVASHNYNPNYQGYYNNPSQNYISPAPMVLYPQLYSTVNQNQIHLHLHGDLSDEQVTIAGGNLTISSNRLEIGVLGEESEQRNDVWRPY